MYLGAVLICVMSFSKVHLFKGNLLVIFFCVCPLYPVTSQSSPHEISFKYFPHEIPFKYMYFESLNDIFEVCKNHFKVAELTSDSYIRRLSETAGWIASGYHKEI